MAKLGGVRFEDFNDEQNAKATHGLFQGYGPHRLIAVAASSIAALPACGQSDPMRKQFAKDIKKQKERRPGRIDEAFVSSWMNAAGENVHATCMIYASRERTISLVVSPHGDGIATLERGNMEDADWVKYCSTPIADASGNPIRSGDSKVVIRSTDSTT